MGNLLTKTARLLEEERVRPSKAIPRAIARRFIQLIRSNQSRARVRGCRDDLMTHTVSGLALSAPLAKTHAMAETVAID
jgi:hypothetical protein